MHLRWHLFCFFLAICLATEPLLILATQGNNDSAFLVLFYIAGAASIYLLTSYVVTNIYSRLLGPSISLFISFSLLELKLIYFEPIYWQSTLALSLVLIILFGILNWLAFYKNPGTEPNLYWYFVSAGALALAPALVIVMYDSNYFHSKVDLTSEEKFLERLSSIEFGDKPNIYLLSYDSMIRTESAQKYLGINELDYDVVLRNNFTRLSPAVSESIPTKPSLNGLMRLDQRILVPSYEYFSGKKPSALSAIFTSNGYRITTGYTTYDLGTKGPYIDRYIVSTIRPLSKTMQCIGVGTGAYNRLRGYGVCEALGDWTSLAHLAGFISGEDIYKSNSNSNSNSNEVWHSTVYKEIERATETGTPELKLFYTYRPNGHTPLDYVHSDIAQRERYRNYFLEGSAMLAEILEQLTALVSEKDPNSIFIVFGDHGAYLSRGLRKSTNQEFYLEDRHLIYLAVMKNKNRCTNMTGETAFYTSYFTPSRVMASIINCLAAGDNTESILSFDNIPELIQVLQDDQGI